MVNTAQEWPAFARQELFFRDALPFRPQRWLAPGHALYDEKYVTDSRDGFHLLGLGPRVCIGKEVSWIQGRLFMAKILWTFDLIKLLGQKFDLEKARTLAFWVKPEARVKFVPVKRRLTYKLATGEDIGEIVVIYLSTQHRTKTSL